MWGVLDTNITVLAAHNVLAVAEVLGVAEHGASGSGTIRLND